MAKHDSFFSEKAPEALNKKILAAAEAEMENLKKKNRKFTWGGFFLPLGTMAALSVLAFFIYSGTGANKLSEGDAAGLMAVATMGNDVVMQVLEEEEEALEIADELGVLEDYETLMAISDVELEG